MHDEEWPQPLVVVSQCLGFAAVRYNAQVLQDRFVRALEAHVRFVAVCPEVGIGLGVPRDPVRIVSINGERRLIQPATGADLTERMHHFREEFLGRIGPVDGFILKSRSPSCGIKDVKVYPAQPGRPLIEKSAGLFAETALQCFPHAAIEDEGRLTHFEIRHHFLTRIYAVARLREVRRQGILQGLVQFHTHYKLQLLAYTPTGLRDLGRIVANAERHPIETLFEAYADRLAQVMARPARVPSTVNVLMHAFGYVSKRLTPAERGYFLELLDGYRHKRVPLSAVLSVLRAWIVRFDEPYLASQRFFEPYPRALLDLTDSGRGRL